MRHCFVAIICSILLLSADSASSATKELTRAIFDAIPWDQDQPTVEQRQAFAKAIEAYWENFDTRSPRLSPNEKAWIEEELGAQGDRLERAFRSKEYAIWSLNKHVDLCLSVVRSVIQSYTSEQARETEMFYWVRLVNCYDGTDDVSIHLRNAGIQFNDDGNTQIQTPLSNLIQGIIVNKVTPMAMAETMDWTINN